MIEDLKKEVNECTKCPNLIHCKEAKMSPAIMKHPNAKILFILQNPGIPLADEINKDYEEVLINSRQGRMFLKKFLEKMNLKYEDVCWSNICKCASPENRPLEKEEMDNCYPILQKQVDYLEKLMYVIILGKQSIDYLKEHPLKLKGDIKIVNFYHPSYIFRTGQYNLIDDLVSKIKLENYSEILQIQNRFNTVYETCRDNEGFKKLSVIEFPNYFYVKEKDLRATLDIIKDEVERNVYHAYEEPRFINGFKSIYGEDLIKITPNKFEFWKIKKLLWKNEIQTYEYSLDIHLKYLLNNKDKKFSKNRSIGLIDIENDMSLDCENTPALINAITIYNYQKDNYYTWVVGNPQNERILDRINKSEVIYRFNSDEEVKMLIHFIENFKLFDFDVVGGWNSNDFDFPYLINRIKKIGLNPNDLSRFSRIENAVETRSYILHTKKGIRKHWNNFILGIELIDFIPILQKATCYKPQPSSWSLESTANFYLGSYFQKLIKIGAESWRKDINNFITYNIKDVEIVKELIDRFKLIDFFIMVQTEITPVPLNNVTHNSVVLLSYLKHLFPESILPDNPGYKYLENEKIDLKKYRIKMKAAHVINAVPGIHENVSIFDFAQLYSSIFQTFNISPETLSNENGITIDDVMMWKINNSLEEKEDEENSEDMSSKIILKEYTFSKKYIQDKTGKYPVLLKNLIARRKVHKQKREECVELYGLEDERTLREETRSDYLKQVANSIYGCSGYNKTILFNPQIGASVTSISRKLIKYVEEWVNKKEGYKILSGDTDSCFIKHPKGIDIKEFEKELNNQIKDFIFKNFTDINKENYCMYFEYAKSFKTFVMKDAKKKYYGIIDGGKEDGKLYVKGFDLIQHVISDKIKEIIKEIYIMLMKKEDRTIVKNKLNEFKKLFFTFSYKDLTQQLRLANDPESYKTNDRHARAAKYSNKYLGTNFKANAIGRLVFIKKVDLSSGKYPTTDVVFLDETIELPSAFKIDYELSWQKLVLDKILLLESIDEMGIKELLSPNKSLLEYK